MRADRYYPGTKGNSRWYPDNLVIAPPTNASYIFVDGNKSAGGAGNSWEDAYATIQAAVDSASKNDVIMIAPVDSDSYYAENVLIGGTAALEYGLVGLHLMGVTNSFKNVRIKASSATTKYPYSSLSGVTMLGSCITVLCSSIEISNLCLDAGEDAAYTGIYRTDGSRLGYTGQTDGQNSSTHDCTFKYGTTGINFDGASNDHLVFNNIFYKQADEGIYMSPGGLQQCSRIYVYNNFFNGPENYGVFIYATALNKDHIIGPGNVFKDRLSDTTTMTNPVCAAHATPTNAVVGNWNAAVNDNSIGTKSHASGNYDGQQAGSGVYVYES